MANGTIGAFPIEHIDPALFAQVISLTGKDIVLTDGTRISGGSVVTWLALNGLLDQSNVVAALDAALGNSDWQTPGTGVTDGDKGDITVSGSGSSWSIDNDAITTLKIIDGAVTGAKLEDSGATAGSYTNVSLTVDVKGRITAISNGTTPSAGRSYVSLSNGDMTAEVAYFGVSAPTISSAGVGDYTVTAPAGTDIVGLEVFGRDTTLSGADFFIRVDNSANSKDLEFASDMYNPNNGAFVDVFNQSNNHTRTISGNVTSLIYPTMNLFGTTGFKIILTR